MPPRGRSRHSRIRKECYLAQCAGLGPHLPLNGRFREAVIQRAIDAGFGQRLTPFLAPHLLRHIGQQPRKSARCDLVVVAQATAVDQIEIRVGNTRVHHELSHHPRPLLKTAIGSVELAQQAQQKFGVQILAGLIGHRNVFSDGHRHVRPKDAAALRGSGRQILYFQRYFY